MLKQLFQKDFESVTPNASFYALRQKSWGALNDASIPKCFSKLEQPLVRSHKTSLSTIPSQIYAECKGSFLLFIDGTFCPSLSDLSALPSSIVLSSLSEAEKTFGTFLHKKLGLFVQNEQKSLSLLNLALHSEGAFLYIPPNLTLTQPIHCLHLLSTPYAYSFPRIHLSVGANSHISWISSTYSQEEKPLFSHSEIDLSLDQGASCHMTHINAPLASHVTASSLIASLKKDSSLQVVSSSKGSIASYEDYQIALTEPNSSANLQGIAMLGTKREVETHVQIQHLAPHTRSTQRFKGVLKENSRFHFKGKIKVDQEAQKTEAYQLNNHLILGSNAFASSDPTLEIFADDVKASHGATVAQISPQELLYLRTRGIDETLGKQLLISGFCQEILTQIPHLFILKDLLKDPFLDAKN